MKDFQLTSLKALAHAALRLGAPAGHSNTKLRFEDLYVSGELSRRLLHFGKQVTLHASPHNSGAREAAEALGAAMGSQLLVSDGTDHKAPTHFLLYLNAETFAGEEGRLLAEELRQRATWKRKADTPQLHKEACLLYTSPSPRDGLLSRMPSSA